MTDVCIIGGGPAGLMCAGQAAARGLTVLLLEKNDKLGKKLDITGGGRCNITNATFDNRKLAKNYGDSAKFLHSAFAQHSAKDTIEFFEKLDLEISVQARKRCFPKSEHAPDVTQAMRRWANETGRVETKLKSKVLSITKSEDGFNIETKKETYQAKQVVIACGGTSHPETGSTGDGFTFLKELGHSVHWPNPSLVPLTVVETDLTESVSGTSLTFMKIRFWQRDKVQFSKTGKVLFTHFGLSGPLILNSSYEVMQLLETGAVTATVDMFPDTELPDVDEAILKVFNKQPNKLFRNVIKEIVPSGMTPLFTTKYSQTLLKKEVNVVTKAERRQFVDDLKSLRFEITGNMGHDWAIVADGGADLTEFDTRTFESKLVPGLYAIGDSLHINRPSGGYSLQLCWTTGWVAGDSLQKRTHQAYTDQNVAEG